MTHFYFDNMASTLVDPEVIATMLNCWQTKDYCANHASDHVMGQKCRDLITQAKHDVLHTLSADGDDDLTFTSGATESIHLALHGVAYAYSQQKKHIISFATEHSATLACLSALEKQGFTISILPVLPSGHIDYDLLSHTINDNTLLLTVMHINNETGVIHNLEQISTLCQKHGVLLHVDAAQTIGKCRLDLNSLAIDFASFSAHKCHGPQGIGALYRSGKPKRRLIKQIPGSSHYNAYRPGTLPTALIVGMAKAFTIANRDYEKNLEKIYELFQFTQSNLPSSYIWHGDTVNRVPHNVNIALPAHVTESECSRLRNYYTLSQASSCNKQGHSHVLTAMGIPLDIQLRSLRIGLSRFNSLDEVRLLVQALSVV